MGWENCTKCSSFHALAPNRSRVSGVRWGQVYDDKWAALVQFRWVSEASEHYPGNHGIADHNLERIRRLFGNLLSLVWRWSVGLVGSLYFLYSGRYLLLQKAKKCRLNQQDEQGGIQLKVNNIYFELFDKYFDSFAVNWLCSLEINFTNVWAACGLLCRNWLCRGLEQWSCWGAESLAEPFICITEYTGFDAVCLNRWVL